MPISKSPFGEPVGVFELPSNSGWQEMRWTLLDSVFIHGQNACLCSLELKGRSWDVTDEEFVTGRIVDDHVIQLRQLLIDTAKLAEIEKKLTAWLQRPANIEQELAVSESHQSCVLSIGPEPDVSLADEKPVARLTLSNPSPIDYWFVVDQSCIRLFNDDICRVIHSVE